MPVKEPATLTDNDILEAALKLPPHAREDVAVRLLDSLREAELNEVEKHWIAEAKARRAAYKAGLMKAIPGEEVFRKLRDRS